MKTTLDGSSENVKPAARSDNRARAGGETADVGVTASRLGIIRDKSGLSAAVVIINFELIFSDSATVLPSLFFKRRTFGIDEKLNARRERMSRTVIANCKLLIANLKFGRKNLSNFKTEEKN